MVSSQLVLAKILVDLSLLQTKGWEEKAHPRAKDGKFGGGDGVSESSKVGGSNESADDGLKLNGRKKLQQATKGVVNFIDKVSGQQGKRRDSNLMNTLGAIAVTGVVAIGSAILLKRSGEAVKAAKKALKDIQVKVAKDKNTSELLHDKIIDLRNYASGAKKGIDKELRLSSLSEDIVSGSLFNKENEEAIAKKHGAEAIRFLNNWDKADEITQLKMKDYASVQAGLKSQFETLQKSLKDGGDVVTKLIEEYDKKNSKRVTGLVEERFAKGDVKKAEAYHSSNIASSIMGNIVTSTLVIAMMDNLREEYSEGLLRDMK